MGDQLYEVVGEWSGRNLKGNDLDKLFRRDRGRIHVRAEGL